MTGFRAWRRRLQLGLPTVLGLEPRAFLIPYRYAATLPSAGSRAAYAPVEAAFERHRQQFKTYLEHMEGLRTELLAIGDRPAPAPRWGQDWFPRLDGAAAYTMVRNHRPARIVEILCDAEPESEAGGRMAYHAMTGGFILAEVARRASGRDVRALLREKLAGPLGLRWFDYGVAPDEVGQVAINASTGLPNLPPLSQLVRRALSSDLPSLVESSNDPRFLTGIVPAANIVSTAREVATFYQCLLDGGIHQEKQIFEERTIRQATEPQTGWELDYTLLLPVPYSLGFMLGSRSVGLFGLDNPQAFGHVGLSNVFTWADPERDLVVALLTTGKPILGLHVPALLSLLYDVGRVFPKRDKEGSNPSGTSYFS